MAKLKMIANLVDVVRKPYEELKPYEVWVFYVSHNAYKFGNVNGFLFGMCMDTAYAFLSIYYGKNIDMDIDQMKEPYRSDTIEYVKMWEEAELSTEIFNMDMPELVEFVGLPQRPSDNED